MSPAKVIGNIKNKRSRAFREIAKIGKADIKKELRSSKTGQFKPEYLISRYRASPVRRSAAGESLARETGASERLITSQKELDKLHIGFKNNPSGDNYVYEHETANNRPTIGKSKRRTNPSVIKVMQKIFDI